MSLLWNVFSTETDMNTLIWLLIYYANCKQLTDTYTQRGSRTVGLKEYILYIYQFYRQPTRSDSV